MRSVFRLRVRGDSMTGVHIIDGDLAIIRVQQRVENVQIAAVLVQDILIDATLKIVRRKWNILMLEPANRRYKVLAFKGLSAGVSRTSANWRVLCAGRAKGSRCNAPR